MDGLSGQKAVIVGGAAVTLNTRYTFASRLRSAEQFIYEYYQQLGLSVRYANWTYGNYSGRNVVAEVRGTHAARSKVLLVGGHLDNTSQIPYTTGAGRRRQRHRHRGHSVDCQAAQELHARFHRALCPLHC